MDLKYSYMILIGAIMVFIAVAVFIFYKPGRTVFKKGIKSANAALFKNDAYYIKKKRIYLTLRIILITAVMGGILSSCLLLARPYHIKKIKEEQYNRDIIICLDVSTSVNALNYRITKELQTTVSELNGERVGIVMFNTSPVLVSPVTDDYAFTIEQLQNIRHAIKVSESPYSMWDDDWIYWEDFLFSGTLVGNEDRGSSLIADGLMGAAFNFPQTDEKRTKIIIFATDNEPYGDSLVTLEQAADYCKQNNIIVYGIGTKEMGPTNMDEMRFAMERTGGKFYLEEDAGTYKNIIEDIESQSASKVKGKTIIKEVEDPQFAFSMMVLCFAIALVAGILLRRSDMFWIVRHAVVFLLLIALLVTFIIPTLSSSGNNNIKIKTKSNLNVLFVIDDTISMVARDYGNETERLTAAKAHCNNIVDELDGARFSVITFNNNANIMSPFTTNSDHIKNVIDALKPVDSLYAKGTSLNTVKESMGQVLAQAASNKNSKTVVFFVSDGEITDGSSLDTFSELSQYINGGAVLGYGTEKGGNMWVKDTYAEQEEQIMDTSEYPYEPAVSKIDEKNLKALATDLGVTYINMNKGDAINGIVSSLKKEISVETEQEEPTEDEQETKLEAEVYWGWIFAIPILIMFIFESGMVLRKR